MIDITKAFGERNWGHRIPGISDASNDVAFCCLYVGFSISDQTTI